ncbi:MAG: uroporphyrinogen decarboxylase family protein [Planctomycetota bacterium]|jgi:uroporphyrinogen decarboxylase
MADNFLKGDLISTMRCRDGTLLPCKLDWPIQKIGYWHSKPIDSRPPGALTWQDNWGITWRKESPDPAMMPFPIAHPLGEGLEGLLKMTWPDPEDPLLFADLANIRTSDNHLLIGEHPFAIYQRAWMLAGIQNLLGTMVDTPKRADELFAQIGKFEETIARRYISLGVEAAWISDDYGTNSALMFSPDMWKRFIKPHLKRIVNCYHDAGVLVILHSCGNITPLIDDFLDLGIDVLDPLQPNCNRLDLVREKTSGRMCLCGGIESSILLAGDIENTTAQTHKRIKALGGNGGFIVGPDDEWDFPLATREAMIDVVNYYRNSARGSC